MENVVSFLPSSTFGNMTVNHGVELTNFWIKGLNQVPVEAAVFFGVSICDTIVQISCGGTASDEGRWHVQYHRQQD